MKNHNYTINLEWLGNEGFGTRDYKSYNRNHKIEIDKKYDAIMGSSDPSFRGDPQRYNPEELFLSSIAACHMFWYLHLCSVHNIVVEEYMNLATGTMEESENGSGRFVEVLLNPRVQITDPSMITMASSLHEEAKKMCFIANSCNFVINHHPITLAKNS